MFADNETVVPGEVTLLPDFEEEATDDADPPDAKKTASSRRSRLSLDDVVSYFAPCGRCGYFLAGYRAAKGMENLETAVSHAKSGWIVLDWNQDVRELVLKSYGCRIEDNDLHYESCCSECRRHFIFRASRSPNHPDTLRIEIKPRKRQ
ncbi:MAG: hypothetical protein H6659_00615 [Ardenticatenaceae bacterium]|nr:hypothetical protein [Ardenticatenaceae bacterium]